MCACQCPVWLISDAVSAHWGLTDPNHLQGSAVDRAAALAAVAGILKTRIAALLNEPFETPNRTALSKLLSSLGEQ